MTFPHLRPPRDMAAAAFVALALGLGSPAFAEAPVTGKQAAAIAADSAHSDHTAVDDSATAVDPTLNSATDGIDLQTIETVIWSESAAADEQPLAWYPPLAEEEGAIDLTLSGSPVQVTTVSPVSGATGVITNEHAVIPLPPAAWTGLAGLASLATIRGRKAIVRFFT